MTSPPMTAVRRVDFLRQIDTSRGDNKYDTARFVAPIHTKIKKRNDIKVGKYVEIIIYNFFV